MNEIKIIDDDNFHDNVDNFNRYDPNKEESLEKSETNVGEDDYRNISLDTAPPSDAKNRRTMFLVYVIYGFSVLGNYNTIISSLGFLIKSMPGHNPSFWVGLGLQSFVAFS